EAHAAQPRAEDDARDPGRRQARELDEFAPVQVSRHVPCTSDSQYTGTSASDCSRPRRVSGNPSRPSSAIGPKLPFHLRAAAGRAQFAQGSTVLRPTGAAKSLI